jgi:hypothetical protein
MSPIQKHHTSWVLYQKTDTPLSVISIPYQASAQTRAFLQNVRLDKNVNTKCKILHQIQNSISDVIHPNDKPICMQCLFPLSRKMEQGNNFYFSWIQIFSFWYVLANKISGVQSLISTPFQSWHSNHTFFFAAN